MNNFVRGLDPEKLLFFDIETASRNEKLDPKSKEYELFAWSKRDKVTSELPPKKEVLELYKKEAALKPEFNSIVCISVGFLKDGALYYKTIKGDQKEMIEEFYSMISSTGFAVAGHNIIGFDMPTVRLKGFEVGADLSLLPTKFEDSMSKPWLMEEALIDTMAISKGTYFYNLSLDSLCMMAGIKSPKEDIKGSEVTKAYYNGKIDKIREYCNQDVIASAKLFVALQGKGYKIKKEVCKNELDISSDDNIFQSLIKTGKMSAKFKKDIKKKVKGFSEEEMENVKEIITAHYLEAKSKKADKEKRIKEVENLMDEIK